MKEINLNMHDILKIKIKNPSRGLFEQLNSPFAYFTVSESAEPDIEIELGSFIEDTSRAQVIDHKYYVKDDYIFFTETIGCLKWKVEIRGLTQGKCRVKMSYGVLNRILFPHTLYPDQVLYNYLLYPLLEKVFTRKGYLFLHAGCAERHGKAFVFAGRGGSFKTSFIMNLVKKHGFRSMGDGWIIIKGKEVYSFPTCLSFFDYRIKNLSCEGLSLYHKINITRFLLGKPRGMKWIKDRARIDHMFIIHREDRSIPSVEPIISESLSCEALLANNQLEWRALMPYNRDISSFFDAYEYFYPPLKDTEYRDRFKAGLLDTLNNIPVYKLRIPLEWTLKNIDTVKNIIG